MQRNLLFLALFCFSSSAFALSVTSISGASASDTTGTIKIYGGTAGDPVACNSTGTNEDCDSCLPAGLTCPTTPLCACNTSRIFNNRTLTIGLKKNETNNSPAIILRDSTSLSLASTNDGSSVSIKWTTICGAMGSLNCENIGATNNTITLKIVIDKDNSNSITGGEESVDVTFYIVRPADTDDVHDSGEAGIGAFSIYPGDEKVYIEGIVGDGEFPSFASGVKAKSVRVFSSDVNMSKAVPGDGLTPADLSIVEDGNTLSNSIVDGLQNGTAYGFRIALVDEANNVLQFFPPLNPGGTCNNPTLDTTCQYVATPDEVLGLLTDDMNCFIATASYGSSFEPHVQTLRKFRNRVLLRYQWGTAFVKKYYQYGPIAARFIHQHDWLKPLVRIALWPALGFSWMALNFGLIQAALCSLLILLLIIGPAMLLVGRRTQRA